MFGWKKQLILPDSDGSRHLPILSLKALLCLPPDQYFASLDALRASDFSLCQSIIDGLGEVFKLTNNLLEIVTNADGDVVCKIMDCAYLALHSEKISLFQVDLSTNEAVFTYSRDDIRGMRVPVNDSIVGSSIQERSVINVIDAYNSAKFCKTIDEATHFHTVSVLCQPIMIDDVVVAAVQAVNKRLIDDASSPCVAFSELDEVLIQIVGSYLSLILKSHDEYPLRRPSNNSTSSIYVKNLVAEFAHELDFEDTLKRTVESAAQLVNAERVSVFLLDEPTGELFLALSPDAKGLRVSTSTGLVGKCFREGRAIISSNAQADHEFNNAIDSTTGFRTKSTLCCPIFGESLASGCIGVIQAINKLSATTVSFTETDKGELLALSRSASSAIRSSKLFAQTLKESTNFKSVLKISLCLLANDSYESVLFDIATELKNISDADDAKLYKCDPASQSITVLSSLPNASTRSSLARKDSDPSRPILPIDLQGYILEKCEMGWSLAKPNPMAGKKGVNFRLLLKNASSDNDVSVQRVSRSTEEAVSMIQEVELVHDDRPTERFVLVPITALSAIDNRHVPSRQTVIVIHLGDRKLSPQHLSALDSLVKTICLVIRTKTRNEAAVLSPATASGKSTPVPPLATGKSGILSVESITSAMSLISQSVFIVDKRLSFVWSNKSLSDLFGDDYSKAPSGSHLNSWLPEEFGSLLKDIELVQELLQPVNVTQAKFFTQSYPNGIVLSYSCHPIMVGVDDTQISEPKLDQSVASDAAKNLKKMPSMPASSVFSFLSRSTGIGKAPVGSPTSKAANEEKKRPASSGSIAGSIAGSTRGRGFSGAEDDSDSSSSEKDKFDKDDALPNGGSVPLSSNPPPRGLLPSRSLTKAASSRRLLSSSNAKLPLSARGVGENSRDSASIAAIPVSCGVVVVIDTQSQTFASSWEKRLTDSQLGSIQSLPNVISTIEDLLSMATSKFELNYESQSALGDIAMALKQSKKALSDMGSGDSSRVSTTDATTSMPVSLERSPVIPVADIPLEVSVSVVTAESLVNWNFDALGLQKLGLHQLPFLVFNESGLLAQFNISNERFKAFVDSFEPLYHDNPFHNLWHANTVAHMCFMLLKETRASAVLDPLYKLALLVSAYCHDLDHPGNTNAFEMNSSSELAVRYNDQSVLENHHCSMTFKILRHPSCDMMNGFSTDTYKTFRKTLVTSILGTDMALHFQLYDQLKSKVDNPESEWQITSAQDSQFFVKVLLHAADLSNPVRTFDMTKRWATRIATEFNRQVMKERASNLPVLGFMETKTEQEQAKNELNFVSLFVEPMWKTLSDFLPEVGKLVQNMEGNLATWKEISMQTVISPLATAK